MTSVDSRCKSCYSSGSQGLIKSFRKYRFHKFQTAVKRRLIIRTSCASLQQPYLSYMTMCMPACTTPDSHIRTKQYTLHLLQTHTTLQSQPATTARSVDTNKRILRCKAICATTARSVNTSKRILRCKAICAC